MDIAAPSTVVIVVDDGASLIAADANKCRSTPGDKWSQDINPMRARRAVQDYLANLDDPA